LSQLVAETLPVQKIRLSKKRIDELVSRLLTGEIDIQFDAGKRHEHKSLDFADEGINVLHERAENSVALQPVEGAAMSGDKRETYGFGLDSPLLPQPSATSYILAFPEAPGIGQSGAIGEVKK
jgi:hypothetical protein